MAPAIPTPISKPIPSPIQILIQIRLRRFAILTLLLAAVAGCSRNDNGPTEPGPDPDEPTPVSAMRVVGVPRVTVVISTFLVEDLSPAPPLSGEFDVILSDSSSRRVTLPDVRLNDFPMREIRDPLGSIQSYRLDFDADMPNLRMSDTLRFEVRDGGEITPPFSVLIVPSRMELPPDSAEISVSQDLVLPWSGTIDRLILSLIDQTAKRLRVVLTLENFSGQTRLRIPARDLQGMALGRVTVTSDILDVEIVFPTPFRRVILTLETQRRRVWTLVP
jgi:hypothetical protein